MDNVLLVSFEEPYLSHHTIFERFSKLNIDAHSMITGFHRRSPTTVDIYFKSVGVRRECEEKLHSSPDFGVSAYNETTIVTVSFVLPSLDDSYVCAALAPYGEVQDSRRCTLEGFSNICNDKRQYKMILSKNIPPRIRVAFLNVWVSYKGQPKVCAKCHANDHFAKDCKEDFCGRCQTSGHMIGFCPNEIKCTICHKSGHHYKGCPDSFANKAGASIGSHWTAPISHRRPLFTHSPPPIGIQDIAIPPSKVATSATQKDTQAILDSEATQADSEVKDDNSPLSNDATPPEKVDNVEQLAAVEAASVTDNNLETMDLTLPEVVDETRVSTIETKQVEEADGVEDIAEFFSGWGTAASGKATNTADVAMSDSVAGRSEPPVIGAKRTVTELSDSSESVTEDEAKPRIRLSKRITRRRKKHDAGAVLQAEDPITPMTELCDQVQLDPQSMELETVVLNESNPAPPVSADSEDLTHSDSFDSFLSLVSEDILPNAAKLKHKNSKHHRNVENVMFACNKVYEKTCEFSCFGWVGIHEHITSQHAPLSTISLKCPLSECSDIHLSTSNWLLHICETHPEFACDKSVEFMEKYFE